MLKSIKSISKLIPKSKYDVITLGSSTIDVFLKTDSDDVKVLREKGAQFLSYPLGSKILIDKLNTFTGGGGTNTAVSFSRLGLRTAYFGRIGNDDHGLIVLKELKKEKVDFLGKLEGDTAYSVILDSKADDRTALTYKGKGGVLGSCSEKKLEPCNLLYISSVTKSCYKSAENIAEYMKKKGSKIAFNPSTYLASMGFKFLSKMIRIADILILNKQEADLITSHNDIDYSLKKLHSLNQGIVAITDGKYGVYIYDGNFKYSAVPRSVKVVETTGAGDAFASGFTAGIIKGKSIEYSITAGITNAESVISHLGAKNKLLTLKEAEKMMKKDLNISKTKI